MVLTCGYYSHKMYTHSRGNEEQMKTPKIRKVAYFPASVAEQLEKASEEHTSESAFIVDAVKEKLKREKRK